MTVGQLRRSMENVEDDRPVHVIAVDSAGRRIDLSLSVKSVKAEVLKNYVHVWTLALTPKIIG
jgi:hypothetical protein